MAIIKVLAAALAFVWGATATSYLTCQDPDTYRVSSGIQVVCNTLGSNWCATNCNILGKNCQYCQYIPAGSPSRYDSGDLGLQVDALEGWCNKQAYVSSSGVRQFPEILSYSYSQRTRCRSCGGCKYYNNGDTAKMLFERQSDTSPTDGGDITVATGAAPGSSVVLEQRVVGVDVDATNCTLLFQEAASMIASTYSEAVDGCTVSTPTADEFVVSCDTLDDPDSIFSALKSDFNDACEEYGGQMFNEVAGIMPPGDMTAVPDAGPTAS